MCSTLQARPSAPFFFFPLAARESRSQKTAREQIRQEIHTYTFDGHTHTGAEGRGNLQSSSLTLRSHVGKVHAISQQATSAVSVSVSVLVSTQHFVLFVHPVQGAQVRCQSRHRRMIRPTLIFVSLDESEADLLDLALALHAKLLQC